MNKKNIITQKNIMKVADFLEGACNYFKKDGDGCFHFNLSEDLALYVGWSYGYDMADTDIIKSKNNVQAHNTMAGNMWVSGYAVNAAIKIRNDADCADFDFLDYPWYEDGECCDNGISMKPDMTRRDYRNTAKWFLGSFVGMTNEIKSKKLLIN